MQVLNEAQIDEFQDRGYLRLSQQIPTELCGALRDRVWQRLEKRGFERGRPETWSNAFKEHSRLKAIRRNLPLDELYTDEIKQAAFQLLGSRSERDERQLLLLTFPDDVTGYETPPTGYSAQAWHTDCPRVPNVNAPGIIVLTYLDDVDSAGGGTAIVAGSHRICTSTDRPIRSKQLKRYLRRFELGKSIFSKTADHVMDVRGKSEMIDGVLLEVIELTGETGDVILLDGRILHAITSNQKPKPRLVSRGFFHSRELLEHYQIRN